MTVLVVPQHFWFRRPVVADYVKERRVTLRVTTPLNHIDILYYIMIGGDGDGGGAAAGDSGGDSNVTDRKTLSQSKFLYVLQHHSNCCFINDATTSYIH